jgi:hypothetical protein
MSQMAAFWLFAAATGRLRVPNPSPQDFSLQSNGLSLDVRKISFYHLL